MTFNSRRRFTSCGDALETLHLGSLERSDQTTRCIFAVYIINYINLFCASCDLFLFILFHCLLQTMNRNLYMLCVFIDFHWFSSLSIYVNLFPSPRGLLWHFHGTSRPSPSISPSSWRFFCISFHCCLDSTAFVRRISGMAPERFKSPRPKRSYPMPSSIYPQSWFCFGAFWLNNVVLLVSLTVVSF